MTDDELLALAKRIADWPANADVSDPWHDLAIKLARGVIALIERYHAEVDALQERVGFIEGKVDIEVISDHYAWAVNELTARRAYSKSECATLIAEQRAEVKRLTRELEIAEQDAAHFNRLAFVDVGANPPVAWKDEATRLTRERDEARAAMAGSTRGELLSALAAAQKRIEVLDAALKECEEYFDNRADADGDSDGFHPNEEMRLLVEVRDALKESGNGDETVRPDQQGKSES